MDRYFYGLTSHFWKASICNLVLITKCPARGNRLKLLNVFVISGSRKKKQKTYTNNDFEGSEMSQTQRIEVTALIPREGKNKANANRDHRGSTRL